MAEDRSCCELLALYCVAPGDKFEPRGAKFGERFVLDTNMFLPKLDGYRTVDP